MHPLVAVLIRNVLQNGTTNIRHTLVLSVPVLNVIRNVLPSLWIDHPEIQVLMVMLRHTIYLQIHVTSVKIQLEANGHTQMRQLSRDLHTQTTHRRQGLVQIACTVSQLSIQHALNVSIRVNHPSIRPVGVLVVHGKRSLVESCKTLLRTVRSNGAAPLIKVVSIVMMFLKYMSKKFLLVEYS